MDRDFQALPRAAYKLWLHQHLPATRQVKGFLSSPILQSSALPPLQIMEAAWQERLHGS